MDIETKKQILKYSGAQWWHYAAAGSFLVFGLLLLFPVIISTGRAKSTGIYLVLFLLVFGVLALCRLITVKRAAENSVDSIIEMGQESFLSDDFTTGIETANTIILGNKYIICKATGTVIAYQDIQNVYVKKYNYKFKELCRRIWIVDIYGKKRLLCTMLRTADTNMYTVQIFEDIQKHNSNISVIS